MSVFFRLPLRPFLPKPTPSGGQRVLLVRDDVIGDLIVPTSAVVRWLVQQGYDVYLVVREDIAAIGAMLLPKEKLFPVDIKKYRASLSYRYGFLKRVRAVGFDYAIGSTIHSSVNDDIVRSSGAPERWGYRRSVACKEYFRLRGIKKVATLPVIDTEKREYLSVVEHERHFLETIFSRTISGEDFFPSVTPPAVEAPQLPEKYVHYLAEAGAVKRVFPPQRLIPILLEIARERGLKVVLTGLKRQNIADENCIDLTGRTTLPEVLAIVNNAAAVIGNESGLTHMGWVLGKKTALFYGGGHWGRFRPPEGVLLLNSPCEYRCCDWKCRYDSVPVPCVDLEDEEVRFLLSGFLEEALG